MPTSQLNQNNPPNQLKTPEKRPIVRLVGEKIFSHTNKYDRPTINHGSSNGNNRNDNEKLKSPRFVLGDKGGNSLGEKITEESTITQEELHSLE